MKKDSKTLLFTIIRYLVVALASYFAGDGTLTNVV